jgi:hypothetical protein
MQAGDMAAAEKDLQLLARSAIRARSSCSALCLRQSRFEAVRPRKATPLLLDASERGYVPAMIPLAGAYAEGKGVPRACTNPTSGWRSPTAGIRPTPSSCSSRSAAKLTQDLEKAKAAAAAYTFKTK